jgi:ABC-type dipeptide/oligopeptide/nickel transport system permease subunit
MRSITLRIWFSFGILVLAAALLGPFFAPHGPNDYTGGSFLGSGSGHLFGTDAVGRDVLSRVLWGGRSIIGLATTATIVAYVIGGAVGLLAGYRGGLVDAVLMRTMDVLLAFPALLFVLLLAAGIGAGVTTIVIGVAAINIPGVARIVRAATLEVSVRGFVEAAVARGERTAAILRREILPNIASIVAADGGVRFTGAFLTVAGLNFLGIGIQPPAADWATMIAENRSFISLQPWTIAAPAICIAVFTITVNVVADGLARGRERSSSA